MNNSSSSPGAYSLATPPQGHGIGFGIGSTLSRPVGIQMPGSGAIHQPLLATGSVTTQIQFRYRPEAQTATIVTAPSGPGSPSNRGGGPGTGSGDRSKSESAAKTLGQSTSNQNQIQSTLPSSLLVPSPGANGYYTQQQQPQGQTHAMHNSLSPPPIHSPHEADRTPRKNPNQVLDGSASGTTRGSGPMIAVHNANNFMANTVSAVTGGPHPGMDANWMHYQSTTTVVSPSSQQQSQTNLSGSAKTRAISSPPKQQQSGNQYYPVVRQSAAEATSNTGENAALCSPSMAHRFQQQQKQFESRMRVQAQKKEEMLRNRREMMRSNYSGALSPGPVAQGIPALALPQQPLSNSNYNTPRGRSDSPQNLNAPMLNIPVNTFCPRSLTPLGVKTASRPPLSQTLQPIIATHKQSSSGDGRGQSLESTQAALNHHQVISPLHPVHLSQKNGISATTCRKSLSAFASTPNRMLSPTDILGEEEILKQTSKHNDFYHAAAEQHLRKVSGTGIALGRGGHVPGMDGPGGPQTVTGSQLREFSPTYYHGTVTTVTTRVERSESHKVEQPRIESDPELNPRLHSPDMIQIDESTVPGYGGSGSNLNHFVATPDVPPTTNLSAQTVTNLSNSFRESGKQVSQPITRPQPTINSTYSPPVPLVTTTDANSAMQTNLNLNSYQQDSGPSGTRSNFSSGRCSDTGTRATGATAGPASPNATGLSNAYSTNIPDRANSSSISQGNAALSPARFTRLDHHQPLTRSGSQRGSGGGKREVASRRFHTGASQTNMNENAISWQQQRKGEDPCKMQ